MCTYPQAKGVHIKGFAPSLDIMQQYRVCLAPIRFGAGLKGKIVDSWAHGLPVCTTPVGAEGMFPHSVSDCDSATEGCPALTSRVGLYNWDKFAVRAHEILEIICSTMLQDGAAYRFSFQETSTLTL